MNTKEKEDNLLKDVIPSRMNLENINKNMFD